MGYQAPDAKRETRCHWWGGRSLSPCRGRPSERSKIGKPRFSRQDRLKTCLTWIVTEQTVEIVTQLMDYLLHFDRHLLDMIARIGDWTYVILFLIVFCETGLVVTPFLPGDSLLFAAGALAARHSLSLPVLLVILAVAAVLGDAVNYAIGAKFGERFLATQRIPWIRKKHLDQTHVFFERYGNKTIVIARFVPIVRTFAPFVAGIGQMGYRQFVVYNVVGGCVWVLFFTLLGYFIGNIPIVKNNFSLIVIGIIVVSVLPMLWEVVLGYRRRRVVTTSGTTSTASQSGDTVTGVAADELR